MSTTTSQSPGTPAVPISELEFPHSISDMIDATETLYRFTAEEYEQIAGLLNDDRVELIDGYLVKKMTKRPPHVMGCARALAALANAVPPRWHGRSGEPIRIGQSTEPEPDVSLARGTADDYPSGHPGQSDIALVVDVSDTTLAKDRRRKRTYGPAGIPDYWIINLNSRCIEVYTEPGPDGYGSRVDYGEDSDVPLVIDGEVVARIRVADILA